MAANTVVNAVNDNEPVVIELQLISTIFVIPTYFMTALNHQWPLLLIWINFNPRMDK